MSLYVNLQGCNICEWLIPNNVTGYSVKVIIIQLYHFDETKYFTRVSYIFVYKMKAGNLWCAYTYCAALN